MATPMQDTHDLPRDEMVDHESEKGSDRQPGSATSNDEEKASPHGAPTEADAKPAAAPPQGPPGGPPPDGGLAAWLQVLGSWMLFFNTWGILNTFGVFQTYYESGELFITTSSNISWIGSVQALMVLFVGALSGPIYDRGHLRILLVCGSFLIVFGFMMLSLCHAFWQCLLAQGFCIGIGGGLLFVPAVAILPTYFRAKVGLAIGLAASGSSMGGIIYPIMFYRLLDEIHFGWSVRILGFTALATLIIPLIVMKQRVQPAKARSIVDTSAFTDGPFIFFVFATFVGFIGLYVGIFYYSFFGSATGLTSPSMAFYLVPILNAGSVFGRTLPNWLSDKIGPLNVITPGAFVVGIILLSNIAVHNLAGIVISVLFFGFFSGIFIALPTVVFVALTADKSKVGSRIGMGFAMAGCGVLCGGPAAGALLQGGKESLESGGLHWTAVWTYGGVCVLGTGVMFTVLRVWRGGWRVMVKV